MGFKKFYQTHEENQSEFDYSEFAIFPLEGIWSTKNTADTEKSWLLGSPSPLIVRNFCGGTVTISGFFFFPYRCFSREKVILTTKISQLESGHSIQ
jgi:hypothetical protein